MQSRRAFLEVSSAIGTGALSRVSPEQRDQILSSLSKSREDLAAQEDLYLTRLFELIDHDTRLECNIKPYNYIDESIGVNASIAHARLLARLASNPNIPIPDAIKELRRHFTSMFLMHTAKSTGQNLAINLEDEDLEQLEEKLLEYSELTRSKVCKIQIKLTDEELPVFTKKFTTLLTALASDPNISTEKAHKIMDMFLNIYNDSILTN